MARHQVDLFSAAVALNLRLQCYFSSSEEMTRKIILRLIVNAARVMPDTQHKDWQKDGTSGEAGGIPTSTDSTPSFQIQRTKRGFPPMPEVETLPETLLVTFPWFNPLSAHAVLSSAPSLMEFFNYSFQQQRDLVAPFGVPERALAALQSICNLDLKVTGKLHTLGEAVFPDVIGRCDAGPALTTEPCEPGSSYRHHNVVNTENHGRSILPLPVAQVDHSLDRPCYRTIGEGPLPPIRDASSKYNDHASDQAAFTVSPDVPVWQGLAKESKNAGYEHACLLKQVDVKHCPRVEKFQQNMSQPDPYVLHQDTTITHDGRFSSCGGSPHPHLCHENHHVGQYAEVAHHVNSSRAGMPIVRTAWHDQQANHKEAMCSKMGNAMEADTLQHADATMPAWSQRLDSRNVHSAMLHPEHHEHRSSNRGNGCVRDSDWQLRGSRSAAMSNPGLQSFHHAMCTAPEPIQSDGRRLSETMPHGHMGPGETPLSRSRNTATGATCVPAPVQRTPSYHNYGIVRPSVSGQRSDLPGTINQQTRCQQHEHPNMGAANSSEACPDCRASACYCVAYSYSNPYSKSMACHRPNDNYRANPSCHCCFLQNNIRKASPFGASKCDGDNGDGNPGLQCCGGEGLDPCCHPRSRFRGGDERGAETRERDGMFPSSHRADRCGGSLFPNNLSHSTYAVNDDSVDLSVGNMERKKPAFCCPKFSSPHYLGHRADKKAMNVHHAPFYPSATGMAEDGRKNSNSRPSDWHCRLDDAQVKESDQGKCDPVTCDGMVDVHQGQRIPNFWPGLREDLLETFCEGTASHVNNQVPITQGHRIFGQMNQPDECLVNRNAAELRDRRNPDNHFCGSGHDGLHKSPVRIFNKRNQDDCLGREPAAEESPLGMTRVQKGVESMDNHLRIWSNQGLTKRPICTVYEGPYRASKLRKDDSDGSERRGLQSDDEDLELPSRIYNAASDADSQTRRRTDEFCNPRILSPVRMYLRNDKDNCNNGVHASGTSFADDQQCLQLPRDGMLADRDDGRSVGMVRSSADIGLSASDFDPLCDIPAPRASGGLGISRTKRKLEPIGQRVDYGDEKRGHRFGLFGLEGEAEGRSDVDGRRAQGLLDSIYMKDGSERPVKRTVDETTSPRRSPITLNSLETRTVDETMFPRRSAMKFQSLETTWHTDVDSDNEKRAEAVRARSQKRQRTWGLGGEITGGALFPSKEEKEFSGLRIPSRRPLMCPTPDDKKANQDLLYLKVGKDSQSKLVWGRGPTFGKEQ
ncbi:hypothetical protein CBR_g61457 [Chara braunii]|uniref:Uncharacterized protein n=1 Tax=Chara braunii TaxID=69332 RepID=A0A388K8M5_CHABU|nr:hypothetical protein CBR_g61457 [Chara braunii]|eukprot:GBG66412.1 hypothetical protein CBR_g61457 [Chara braunii]